MSVITGQVITDEFTTSNAATGAAADADSTPTGTLYVDGVASGAAVTVAAQAGAGEYQFSVTMPTLTVGQRVSVRIVATVAGVAGTGVVWREHADGRIGTPAGATVANDLAAIEDLVDNVEADTTTLLSRLSAARAGYLDVLAGWTGTLRQALRAMAAKAAGEVSSDLTGGSSTYVSTTDSQEAIRDALSAGSASAEDIAAELVGIGAYVSAPSSAPPVGSLGTFVGGTTWIMPAISVGALPADREKLWFTVKSVPGQDDSAAILMVEETDGLLVLNGAPVVAPDNAAAQIVYDDGADTVAPRVEADATEVVVSRGTLYFDVKYRAAGGAAAHQVAAGTLYVVWGITNAN